MSTLDSIQNTTRPVIVGGGISGLAAALTLSQRGQKPIIVEASKHWGGLLRSVERPPYGSFDIGTHILSETGIPELDHLLYGKIDKNTYIQHPNLPNSTFFRGVCSQSGFIDTRALTPQVYQKGLFEFYSTHSKQFDSSGNAWDEATARYGQTFTNEIVAPVLQRLFGKNIAELNARALTLVGLRRLQVDEASEAMRKKSQNSWNDERMCYHQVHASKDGAKHYYPKNGGIGHWSLETTYRLKKMGADMRLSTKITSIELENKRVAIINLDDGSRLNCQHLVWSAPVFPLFSLSGQDMPEGLEPPQLCSMMLTDLVLSHVSPGDCIYLTCHDKDYATFRVTNYAALDGSSAPSNKHGYRFTVEEMRPPGSDQSPSDPNRLLVELKKLGIADKNSTIIKSWHSQVKNGFPVPSNRFISDSIKMAKTALGMMSNLTIIGRGSGRVFFTNEVLIDLYKQLTEK